MEKSQQELSHHFDDVVFEEVIKKKLEVIFARCGPNELSEFRDRPQAFHLSLLNAIISRGERRGSTLDFTIEKATFVENVNEAEQELLQLVQLKQS